MSTISRREFLKRSGLAACAGVIGADHAPQPFVAPPELNARAFALTDVHAHADPTSAISGQLMPDHVTPILGISHDGCWYQLQNGYVPREAVQPILPYIRPVPVDVIGDGFWAEVVAPYSAIREWCAGQAPIVARPAFGAVLYVADRLVDDRGQVWYGVATAPPSPVVGWAPALHYAPWKPDSQVIRSAPHITVGKGELAVYDGATLIGRMAVYSPPLARAATTIRAVRPGTERGAWIGVPWLMELATGQYVYGAFWHNRFGTVSDGPDVELPTFAARWLYELLMACSEPVQVTVG